MPLPKSLQHEPTTADERAHWIRACAREIATDIWLPHDECLAIAAWECDVLWGKAGTPKPKGFLNQ